MPEDEDENRCSTVPGGEFVGVDDTVHRLLLVDRAHPRACATTMALDLQSRSDHPGLDRPAEEAVCNQSRGRSCGLPAIEVLLLEFAEFDAVIGEPVQEVDRDGDSLLAAQESAVGDLVHLVHPALVLPADVAADHIAVDGICEPIECVSGPLLVASSVEVPLGESVMFDEQAADELARA